MMSAMNALGVAAEPQTHGENYLDGLMRDYAGRGIRRKRQVAVLILTKYKAFEIADVAELLGISRWTVKRDMKKAVAGVRTTHGRAKDAA